jgi:hypothetical protein
MRLGNSTVIFVVATYAALAQAACVSCDWMAPNEDLPFAGDFRLRTFEGSTQLIGPGIREGDGYEVEQLGWSREFIIVGLRQWGWRVIAADTAERSGVLSEEDVKQRRVADPRLASIEILSVDVARARLRSR